MAKFCPECGKENVNSAEFCENCGEKYLNQQAPPQGLVAQLAVMKKVRAKKVQIRKLQ